MTPSSSPEFTIWTEGDAPRLTLYGRRDRSLLMSDPDLELPLSLDEIPMALWGLLDLGVRPVAAVEPVQLPPGPMSELIGRRQAHGHGLPADQADAWQRLLDLGVRHWSVRFSRRRAGGREWRRNLETLDGDACLARVRALPDGRVELAPTTGTALLRELIELLMGAIAPP